MTERQRIVLQFLNDKMEANAAMIGRAIISQVGGSGATTAIGASVAGRLRRIGYVTFLPELRAWRITTAGRIALEAME